MEAVDGRDQVVDLGGCALDHHLEAATHWAIRIVAIGRRAGDRGGADGKRAARGGRAAHRGAGVVPAFIGGRRRGVGDDRALGAGGIHRDGGGESAEAQVLIHRVTKLVGTDVALALPVVGTAHAALVGRRTTRERNLIDRRAALLQGHGLGRPTIVGQCRKLRIGVLAGWGRETTAIAVQIIALVGGRAVIEAVAVLVFGDDAPADRQIAGVFEAGTGVAGERAVGDAHRPEVVVDGAAEGASGVAGERAVGDVHRPVDVEEDAAVAAVAQAVGNGEALEGEAAAIDDQHLHLVLAIEGDALPVAIQGHAPVDRERAGEGDVATTGKGDGVAGVIAVGRADIGLQLAVITTIGDDEGGLGMGGSCLSTQRQAQADEQAQP